MSNPLTEPLVELLKWMNSFAAAFLPLPEAISSWAVALVAIAVVVKALTYPLTATQMRSMHAMQRVQPKLKELQKKYENDREKLAQAQMELYREHGVNPFGGCLPLIVQMVVLFALYGAIRRLADAEMRGARFLWIPDLAACEPNPLCSDAPASILPFDLPILLVILVLSQFAYQRYATPPSTDSSAQAMNQSMKLMPLFFAFIFAKLSAGLVLYYTAFNVVSVAQQAWMFRDGGPSSVSLPAQGGGEATSAEPQERATTQKEENATHEPVPRRRRKRRKKVR